MSSMARCSAHFLRPLVCHVHLNAFLSYVLLLKQLFQLIDIMSDSQNKVGDGSDECPSSADECDRDIVQDVLQASAALSAHFFNSLFIRFSSRNHCDFHQMTCKSFACYPFCDAFSPLTSVVNQLLGCPFQSNRLFLVQLQHRQCSLQVDCNYELSVIFSLSQQGCSRFGFAAAAPPQSRHCVAKLVALCLFNCFCRPSVSIR